VGPLELLNLAALLVVLHRGEPIHVGYSGKSQGKVVPQWTQTGKQPVQTWSNLDRDGASPVPYLQVFFSVLQLVQKILTLSNKVPKCDLPFTNSLFVGISKCNLACLTHEVLQILRE